MVRRPRRRVERVDCPPVDTQALLAWYGRVRRPLPWRDTTDPYEILVSEVMLQQTQALRVVPYYTRWLTAFPDPPALARAETRDVLEAWSGLGYNRRALALQNAAHHIAAHGWPDDLTALPGVGPYTAAAVASFAFGRQVAAVDTNVRRVLTRREGPATDVARRAGELLPPGDAATFNQAMMELGATVCRPRAPDCGACPVAPGCQGHPDPAPKRGPATRFEDTDRWARGRIVAALLADEPLPVAGERRERAIQGLVRDGLVVRCEDGSIRLP
jgi:A/G-specific adenine glycosylase